MRTAFLVVALALVMGCIGPSDRRPGLALPGNVSAAPADWGFTDEHGEIAVQVRTPYLLPHSVTIWCASLDGQLYIGARDADTKNWPGWMEARPSVRLGIAGNLYDGTVVRVSDPTERTRIQEAYAEKYQSGVARAEIRFWRFQSGE